MSNPSMDPPSSPAAMPAEVLEEDPSDCTEGEAEPDDELGADDDDLEPEDAPVEPAMAVARQITVTPALLEKFWARVKKRGDHDCWQWMGGVHRFGYGVFYVQGQRQLLARRFLWEVTNGLIQPGHKLVEIETCNNRGCVRPSHMELVSRKRASKRYDRQRKAATRIFEHPDDDATLFNVKRFTRLTGDSEPGDVFVAVADLPPPKPSVDLQIMPVLADIVNGMRWICTTLAALDKRSELALSAAQDTTHESRARAALDALGRIEEQLGQLLADEADRSLEQPPPPPPSAPAELSPQVQLRRALVREYVERIGVGVNAEDEDTLASVFDHLLTQASGVVQKAGIDYRAYLLRFRKEVDEGRSAPAVQAFLQLVAADIVQG